MSRILNNILKRLNLTAKDRADLIKELKSSSSGGVSGNIEERLTNIERKLNDITEEI